MVIVISGITTPVKPEEPKTLKPKVNILNWRVQLHQRLLRHTEGLQPRAKHTADQTVLTYLWHISSNGHHSVFSLTSSSLCCDASGGTIPTFSTVLTLHEEQTTTAATRTQHITCNTPVPWRRRGWRRWSRTRSRRRWRCWEPGSTWWQRWQYQTPPQALAFLLEDKVDTQLLNSY